MAAPPVILSIAGYDPSSGAGITADIKAAAANGCYAVTCITALTVQSTQGVFAVEPVRPELVRDTLLRLRDDFDLAAVRIGMLGSGAVAKEVADFLERTKLPHVILDPVVRSSSGASLLDAGGLDVLCQRLLRLATLITPNTEESALLADADPVVAETWETAEPEIRSLAARLHKLGASGVLVTGGHLLQPVDFLSLEAPGAEPSTHVLRGERVESNSTHGTGCALATAIACLLARGADLVTAVRDAKEYVSQAIAQAYPLGKGVGPLHHTYVFGKK
jgi:hydroxymethylpyrimidine/phosphomethylpyrimidine kinase